MVRTACEQTARPATRSSLLPPTAGSGRISEREFFNCTGCHWYFDERNSQQVLGFLLAEV